MTTMLGRPAFAARPDETEPASKPPITTHGNTRIRPTKSRRPDKRNPQSQTGTTAPLLQCFHPVNTARPKRPGPLLHLAITLLALPLAAAAQAPAHSTNEPPRQFTWSPPLGYVFVEGNCGERDSILAWMSPANPTSIREAQLVRFSSKKDGEDWQPDFQKVTGHFIERWTALQGRSVIVVPGNGGRKRDDPVEVRIPDRSPFPPGTFSEATYLQGYAGGYMDFVNGGPVTAPPLTAARTQGWIAGWTAAKQASRPPGSQLYDAPR